MKDSKSNDYLDNLLLGLNERFDVRPAGPPPDIKALHAAMKAGKIKKILSIWMLKNRIGNRPPTLLYITYTPNPVKIFLGKILITANPTPLFTAAKMQI